MKKVTREWVKKAEGDFNTLQRELRARKAPNYDAACFHAQQCAEKYLKAMLQEAGIEFGKTHNLSVLLKRCLPLDATLEMLRRDVLVLNAYAVEFRYPGESAERDMALEAMAAARRVRESVRKSFALAKGQLF